ncbi:MAG: Crp/Fnr family transcriptional regulator [Aestuariibaculum sp.]
MLPEHVLLEIGAEIKTFTKGDFIFYKGNTAKNFYQIITGEIKMNNFSENGKEFVQGIFTDGNSFGEPPLFTDGVYPANAEVVQEAKVFVLSKNNFLNVMKTSEHALRILKIFANRLYYKSLIAVELSNESSEHRVLSLLDYFKKNNPKPIKSNKRCKIEYTRQDIANLTGLRVETVIRTIKTLEEKGEINIIKRKVYR